MTPQDSMIERTRERLAEKLRAQAWLAEVGVHTHKSGDLVAKFEEDLGKIGGGLSIVVSVVGARESGSQSARIAWRPVRFAVDVCEYTAVRQVPGEEKPGAWAYAEACVAALKLCALEGGDTFPEISDEDIAEVEPPKEWAHVTVVRIPLHMDFDGISRNTTD